MIWEMTVQWFVDQWAVNFLDPDKRLFWGYLLSALVIALVWLVVIQRQHPRAGLKALFSKSVWCSKSARADYLIFTLNSILMSAVVPRLLGSAAVAYLLFELLHDAFGGRAMIAHEMPSWVIAASFTFAFFLLDDLMRYVVHRMMHHIPFLWAFHKVHHSATSLNPLTVLRTHPVEGVIFVLRGAIVQGFCIATFVFFFGSGVSLLMIMGANVFKFSFNALGSNLRHSEIPIQYWPWLEKLFLSPAQHQIHHSIDPRHYDKNFGVTLAVWDVLFWSHCHSESNQKLKYGVYSQTSQFQNKHSIVSLYIDPLREAFSILLRRKTRQTSI